MAARLTVSVGQHSDRGRKETNQDFHGALIPDEPQLSTKGVAIALADGISSSDVAHIASETAVKSFLTDYYCTSAAWSVKRSAQRVVTATNSWLHAQTRRSPFRDDSNRGYVCTLSAMVIKSTTAYLFHVGDARIYRLQGDNLEQLTEDHRVRLAGDRSVLARALGADHQVEIDHAAVPIARGDVFLLATDGVYEPLPARFMARTIRAHADNPDVAARTLVAAARDQGSADNLTAQVVRIHDIPDGAADEIGQRVPELPLPPELEPRMVFDGYEIVRRLHASSRSSVYLAVDRETGTPVALKTPSSDIRHDPAALERFLTEEWIARRIDSPHVLKPFEPTRPHGALYVVMEFVEGQTLTQWLRDNPRPGVEQVRGLVEQIARGLLAFHRQEMIHQDLRPDNILIDRTGTARIIDFGAVRVAGIVETRPARGEEVLGTEQYAAPEYFIGDSGSERSDIFSLGVVTYQMLTGALPYGTDVPQCRTRAALNRLRYRSALKYNPNCPPWVDRAIATAVQPDPRKRHEEVAEFVHELHHPRAELLSGDRPPLMERRPELFWKWVAALLAVVVAILVSLLIR